MRINGSACLLAFRTFRMCVYSRGLDGVDGYLVQSYGISASDGNVLYYWKGKKGGYYSHVKLKKHYG
jgi:hypothetical protein